MKPIQASLAVLGALALLAVIVPLNIAPPVLADTCHTVSSSTICTPDPSSSQPGGPGDGGPGNGGNGPDLPQLPPDQQLKQMEDTCNAALHQLAKVPEKMVVDFSNEGGVSVVPVCNSGLGRQVKLDDSQALALQAAIAANPALMAALKAKGFTADDVVGVVLINGVATLYVHKKQS